MTEISKSLSGCLMNQLVSFLEEKNYELVSQEPIDRGECSFLYIVEDKQEHGRYICKVMVIPQNEKSIIKNDLSQRVKLKLS